MEPVALVVALAIAANAAIASRRASAEPAVTTLALERPRPLPRTAPIGQDARDMRAYDAWVDHPGYAITPQGVLATFREAERGYPQRQCDLFDDLVENDGTLRNLFEAREQAVAGKPWVIQAAGTSEDELAAAQVMGWALRRLPMVTLMKHLLTVNRYGWGAAEIDWGVEVIDGKRWIVPVWLTPVPARRFRINVSSTTPGPIDELRLFADPGRPEGDALSPGKWIILRRDDSRLARSSLMRTAAWFAMAKRLGFRDWLVYSQRFGLPLPTVSYNADDEPDDDELDVAQEIIRKIGTDGGAVIPNKFKLEFHSGAKSDSENSKAHGGLIAHCNAEMSKLINGSTLSNDNAGSGGASYALGEVHATVRWDNILFDAELLQDAFRTQIAVPLMRFNGLAGSAPLLKVQVVRDLDPKQRVEIADILRNKLGIDISSGQMLQELGFREPAGAGDAAPGAPKPEPAKPAKEAA